MAPPTATTALAALLTIAAAHAQPAKPHRTVTMPINAWATLAPLPDPTAPKLDTAAPRDTAEQITVFARAHQREAAWRADIAAQTPAYEASNSDAAQPLLPFAHYTSPEQERLMSLKTDALGLCGALGGYIQCPNLPP